METYRVLTLFNGMKTEENQIQKEILEIIPT